jgi:hypothetical protein
MCLAISLVDGMVHGCGSGRPSETLKSTLTLRAVECVAKPRIVGTSSFVGPAVEQLPVATWAATPESVDRERGEFRHFAFWGGAGREKMLRAVRQRDRDLLLLSIYMILLSRSGQIF